MKLDGTVNSEYFLVVDGDGRSLASTMAGACAGCFSGTGDGSVETIKCIHGKRKRGLHKSGNGTVFLCSSDDRLVASTRIFRRRLEDLSYLIEVSVRIRAAIYDEISQESRRILHNLTTHNAKCLQDIYELLPQQLASSPPKTFVQEAQRVVAARPRDAAQALLSIAKHASAIKTEFAVFKRLQDVKPPTDLQRHEIHKVVLNVFYLFFSDFTNRQIWVNVEKCTKVFRFDYESVFVSLYHVIENASKYACADTHLNVSFRFTDDFFFVDFSMISMEIKAEERILIFEEGISGHYAKSSNSAGSGLGLPLVRRIMKLNGGDIVLHPPKDTSKPYSSGNCNYCSNTFSLILPIR